jgi:dimethylglycine dehydrogenase
MNTQARVVVIGGGAIGVSVAYHLAKYGWQDVVLIEKHELTSGSTWMAAGNCSFFHGNYYCTQVNMKSIEIYQQLEAETGQSVGWHTTGSIRTADNPGRMEELGYIYSMNRCLGLDVKWVTPEQIQAMHPLINTEGIVGGLYWPDDGDVDPNGITMAMSIGAKKHGARIQTHTQVTGIDRAPSGEWLVHTEKGDITCEYVVNAAGLWAPEVARMVGLEIPSIAGEHTHILFEAINAVEDRDSYLPLVRDPDRSIYIRQEMDSLILGLYESKVKQWNPRGVPWDYALTELQPDIDHIADFIEHGIYRFPIMGETGFKHVTDGPITYTPNGDPLVGPAYPLRNFFHACGYSFGITQAGGIGHYLAGWIMNGEPEIDLWPVDSRRYGSYANWAYNHEKIEDTYPASVRHHLPQRLARRRPPEPHRPDLCLPETGGRRLRRLLWMGVPQLFYGQPCGQSRKPGLEAQQYGGLRKGRVPARHGKCRSFGPLPFCQDTHQRTGRRGLAQPHVVPEGADRGRPYCLVSHVGSQRQLQVGYDGHPHQRRRVLLRDRLGRQAS